MTGLALSPSDLASEILKRIADATAHLPIDQRREVTALVRRGLDPYEYEKVWSTP